MHTRRFAILFIALACAIAAPVLPFLAFGLFYKALLVSATHAIFLGIPFLLFINRIVGIKWWSSPIAGFIAACIPAAIKLWPLREEQLNTATNYLESGAITQAIIHRAPTAEDWSSYVILLAFLGLCGISGGIVFWAVSVWTALTNKGSRLLRVGCFKRYELKHDLR
jgi:hypothetical protein